MYSCWLRVIFPESRHVDPHAPLEENLTKATRKSALKSASAIALGLLTCQEILGSLIASTVRATRMCLTGSPLKGQVPLHTDAHPPLWLQVPPLSQEKAPSTGIKDIGSLIFPPLIYSSLSLVTVQGWERNQKEMPIQCWVNLHLPDFLCAILANLMLSLVDTERTLTSLTSK